MPVRIRYISPQRWLGERLKEHRKAAGLTQSAVAAKLKWHQSYVSKVEAGEAQSGVVDFIRHCSVIGADPTALINGLPDARPNR